MSDAWRVALGAAITALAIVFDGMWWYRQGKQAARDAGYAECAKDRDAACADCRQRRADAREKRKWNT